MSGCVQQYLHDPTKPYSFVPVAEFAERFKSFSVGRKIAEDLAKPPPDTPLGSTKHGEPEVRPATPPSQYLTLMSSRKWEWSSSDLLVTSTTCCAGRVGEEEVCTGSRPALQGVLGGEADAAALLHR